MSEVKKSSVSKAWPPPLFPVAGRLPTNTSTVTANYQKQTAEENYFRQGVNARVMRKTLTQGLCGLLALMLFGCSSAETEMAGGNIQAINHTLGAINWLSVNGYRADGGGGRSCCVIMPIKWRPGLKANIEWEVDPDPFAKMPPLGTKEFKVAMAKAESSFQRHSATVDIPEWPETKRCGLTVHFLVCNQIKLTSSCWAPSSPNYPIKDPMEMKEPAVCPK